MRALAEHGPPVPEPGRIERGWREYAETVLPKTESETVLLLVRLGYYAGAAHALGQLGQDSERDWGELVETMCLEVMDATDRLLADSLLGRLR